MVVGQSYYFYRASFASTHLLNDDNGCCSDYCCYSVIPRSGQIVVCCIPFPSFTVFGMSASSTTMTPEVY